MSTPSCSTQEKEIGLSNEHKRDLEKWEGLRNWIHCICIVTFDLELGQAIEVIYPNFVKLSEQERSNVCYLAFPDSNSSYIGDTQYHVRIKQNSSLSQESEALKEYNKKAPIFLKWDKNYYWGYVYFRQVRDRNLPRGYFQKSVVVITKLPLMNLFTQLCALMGLEFFDKGIGVMKVIAREINEWPAPVPGQVIHLFLRGVLYQTYIPNQAYKSIVPTVSALEQSPRKELPRTVILTSAFEGDMFRCLSSVISHVHLLWELVMLGEPIVVMANSPTVCSEMVQALTTMITPLKFCADFRPYFTIHDSEFKEYTSDAQSPPAVILGVTNPFFAKTLRHWPHIIIVNNETQYDSTKYKIKKSENLKVLDSKPGVYTQYKPFLHKDKAILKKLTRGMERNRPEEAQTALLRRHLIELTESFMIPLERYIASLMPLQKNISPFKATPIPQHFNPDDFLATLSISGPQLTSGAKGDWVGLYRRFFKSPNFSGWHQNRYNELKQKLQAIQLEALSQADLTSWVRNKQEVEVVDMILRIRQKLDKSYISDLPLDNCVQDRLQKRIDDITLTLPDDLRVILNHKS